MAVLKIDIHSYWHAGSGRGRGAEADAVVMKTRSGLPYLPGRTIKGLVRESMRLAESSGVYPGLKGRTDELFGQRDSVVDSEHDKGAGRFNVRSGALRFSDARLGRTQEEHEKWESFASTNKGKELEANLFSILSSTAMDEKGLAKNKTLRSVEVAVPLTLYAFVEPVDGTDPAEWLNDLEKALPLLRALGSKRTRGFGRCTVTLLREMGVEG
ncbi:MAG: hypothetical protein GXP49_06250 [Deltaproteobacteria bacterium]|nr:hypothetical protein [Deltaproteobacteria bacterium]